VAGLVIGIYGGTAVAQFVDNLNREWRGTQTFTAPVTFEDGSTWKVATGTLSASQVRNLNATPVEVIAAPGVGKAIVIDSAQFMLDWESAAYDDDGAGEDLTVKFTTASASIAVCDQALCMNADATADDFGIVMDSSSHTGRPLAENEGISITILVGEWAAADLDANGDSPVHYVIRYREVDVNLPNQL
jgi:hypothetical protein